VELALRTVHLLAAAVWVGGTVALVAVAVPYARSLRGEERAAALSQLGRRWRPLGWGALAVLVVTGLLSAYEHDALGRETLLRTDAGRILVLKGALVAALVAFAALHDFVLAPRLARQIRAGHPQAARPLLVRVGWASFALTLAIPVLGVVLASELSHS
jgi:putative copper export protein